MGLLDVVNISEKRKVISFAGIRAPDRLPRSLVTLPTTPSYMCARERERDSVCEREREAVSSCDPDPCLSRTFVSLAWFRQSGTLRRKGTLLETASEMSWSGSFWTTFIAATFCGRVVKSRADQLLRAYIS